MESYAKENLNINFIALDLMSYTQEMIFQPAGVKFKLKNTTYIVIGVYRSPSKAKQGSIETFFRNVRDIIGPYSSNENTAITVMGGMNIDASSNSPKVLNLCNVLKEHNMKLPASTRKIITPTSSNTIYH